MSAEEYYKSLSIEKTKELTLFGFAEAYHKSEESETEKKLKTLMVNLEIQNVDEFIRKASIDDYTTLAKEYVKAIKSKLKE